MAVQLGRKTRPDLEVGICGEHGGEPSSVNSATGWHELRFVLSVPCADRALAARRRDQRGTRRRRNGRRSSRGRFALTTAGSERDRAGGVFGGFRSQSPSSVARIASCECPPSKRFHPREYVAGYILPNFQDLGRDRRLLAKQQPERNHDWFDRRHKARSLDPVQ